MKQFLVTAELDLSQKPDWLDNFRKKYDEPYVFHITLKPGTLVQESDIPKLKKTIQGIIKNYNPLEIEFNNIVFSNNSPTGICIMIPAEENTELKKLQKNLLLSLSAFGELEKIHHKPFDENFWPHLTIGRRLSKNLADNAKKEIGQDSKCKARIFKIVLTIVENMNVEDLSKPRNKTIFNL